MLRELIRHEGTQAMEVIESCNNIWKLRQKPLPEWQPEPVVAQLTNEVENHFSLIKEA